MSSNTDVKMFVTVWEPVIRNQCATTEAMVLSANLNLNYFRRFTHNDNHYACVPSVVHKLVYTMDLSQMDADNSLHHNVYMYMLNLRIRVFLSSTDYSINTRPSH